MSTDEKVRARGAKMRTLVATKVPDHLKQPDPAWAYKRSLRPSKLLGDLWRARHIIRTIVERNLRVRYKQSVLGFAWALLTPLGLLFVFTFVFGRIAKVDTGDIPYPVFAYIGLLAWTFFATGINSGGNALLSDRALLNKAQFPREVFTLSVIIVGAVDVLVALVPLGLLFIFTGYPPAATTPLAILPILVLLMFTVGLALALSVLIVYLRDIRQVLPLLLQIGLFATPVAYGLEKIPAGFRLIYCFINPVAPVIDSLRRTVLLGHAPHWGYLGAGATTAVLMLLFGYILFKRLDSGVTDVA